MKEKWVVSGIVWLLITLTVLLGPPRLSAGAVSETVEAFEETQEYVQPFASLLGTMTNTGWYQSASVSEDFSFYIGLPISITYISSKDREYSGTYYDETCQKCHEYQEEGDNIDDAGCREKQEYTTPTIFGSIKAPHSTKYLIDNDFNVVDSSRIDYSDGIDELADMNILPFATLMAGFSFKYTSLNLRFIGMPKIGGISVILPGFGIQHDLSSFLPEIPVDLSIGANFTIPVVSWEPGENVDGTMKIRGLSNFLGIIAGKDFGKTELLLECGWEHSFLKPSGKLTIHEDDGSEDIVEPSKKFSGRNAFRLSLIASLDIGYNPFIGQSFGSEMRTDVGIISFRKRKD
ncbi:MAG: DUF6588 family protein [Chitinivibrionales bacterium]